MKRYSINESGIGPIKAFFIGLLIIILATAGWFIYKFFFQSVPPTNINISAPPVVHVDPYKTYTDPSNIYSITYLKTWDVSPDSAGSLVITYPPLDNLDLAFIPPAPSDAGFGAAGQFTIIGFKTGTPLSILSQANTGNSHPTPQPVMIGSYPAYYQQVNRIYPPTYVDDQYAIYHNGVTLFVNFQAVQGSSSEVQGFDVSSELPSVLTILKTIKFLN